MKYKNLLIEKEEALATVTINTPNNLNALSDITVHELLYLIDELENDKKIRVVIITGAGKAFVAGADISYMESLSPEQARVFSKDTVKVYDKIRKSPIIFIAGVNGYALGGGCELASACDIRIASQYAKFGLPEVGLGIIPGGGGTQRLPRLIGTQRAMYLALTADIIKADKALEYGIVMEVVSSDELIERTKEIAYKIINNAPMAVKYVKESILNCEEVPLSAGMEYENILFGLCFANVDQKEGMNAFLNKRKAEFSKSLI